MNGKRWILVVLGAGLLSAVACTRLPEPGLPTLAATQGPPPALPTPTPPPAHTDLVVCLADEPASLYLYGDTNREADAILQVIYDGPITLTSFEYRSTLLEKLPSFSGGDARLETVSLSAGDVYLNPETDQPDVLASGQPYLPAGCDRQDCIQKYRTGEVQMDRLVADFSLKPDLSWSDGVPLTAADSVFSFRLDGDPDTPTTKYLFDRTFSYKALDGQTLEWTGLPGFIDAEYQSNVWTPLPEHQLKDLSAEALTTAEVSARLPMGWGPYQIDNWVAGQQIVLTPNDHFWEGVDQPPFRRIVFRFLGGQAETAVDQLRTGECDALDEALLGPEDLPGLEAAQASGDIQVASFAGSLVMRLDLNLDPMGPGVAPGLFSDPRTRRALDMCIDRQSLITEDLNGAGQAADSFLPGEHPLYVAPDPAPAFDPKSGQQLLDVVGWKQVEADTSTRVSDGVSGVPDGTPLRFEILAPQGSVYASLGSSLASELARCGVEVNVRQLAAADLFAGWPDGPVFGRDFQAVIWSWPSASAPPCEMFSSWEIPSADHPFGSNASGFSHPDYDAACRELMFQVPDMASYADAAARVQSVFQTELPALPLFVRPRIVAYAAWLCGVEPDASALSVFGNLANLAACPAPGG